MYNFLKEIHEVMYKSKGNTAKVCSIA